jgi:hypothetical protein
LPRIAVNNNRTPAHIHRCMEENKACGKIVVLT